MKWFYSFVWHLVRYKSQILFGMHAEGLEHIPMTGPILVAVNHQSYFDPPFTSVMIKREMHFFAKQELFRVFGLGYIISKLNAIPVRRGTYDPASLTRVFEVLGKGGGLILFPEGTRDGGREFLKPKPGIGLIARKSSTPIIPAFVYRTNKIWGALLARRRMKIVFGPPISVEEVNRFSDDKEGYRALAELVMERIKELKLITIAD
jgi:1-acyl-sn-glycerol-3-phosphate acyltransferase